MQESHRLFSCIYAPIRISSCASVFDCVKTVLPSTMEGFWRRVSGQKTVIIQVPVMNPVAALTNFE